MALQGALFFFHFLSTFLTPGLLNRSYNFKRLHHHTGEPPPQGVHKSIARDVRAALRDRLGSASSTGGRPNSKMFLKPLSALGGSALSRSEENQSPSAYTFNPILASALSQNGASSEVAEILGVAEARREITEGVRKLPKESSGEGGWRISSQDSERTGSISV